MSEQITEPVETVEPTSIEVPETPEAMNAFKGVEVNDFNEKGLYKGRWNNPAEMAEYIKKIEDKHASVIRDQKNAETATVSEVAKLAQESKALEVKTNVISELAPEFIANGMNVTDEMMEKLNEAGISETEVKLAAYEERERQGKAHSVVGGQENYNEMMQWATAELSDDEKKAFNKDIGNANVSAFAIEGLYNRFQNRENGEKPTVGRIRGNPQSQTISGFASRADLFAAKKFHDSRSATEHDKKIYRQRVNLTPESVYM